MDDSRIIVWEGAEGHHGLGDRLRGMFSLLPLAKTFDARLLVRWDLNDECPFVFEDLFHSQYVSTYHRPATARDIQRLRPLLVWNQPANWLPQDVRRAFSSEHLSFIPLNSHYDEAFSEGLQSISPVETIERRVDTIAEGFRKLTIGVHLRRTDALGDKYRLLTEENVRQYDRELFDAVVKQAKLSPSDETAVFVASDSRNYLEEWSARLAEMGIQVVTTNPSWGAGFRQTAGHDVAVDMLLMGRCDIVLKSCYSSLMMVADWISGKEEIRLSSRVILSAKVQRPTHDLSSARRL